MKSLLTCAAVSALVVGVGFTDRKPRPKDRSLALLTALQMREHQRARALGRSRARYHFADPDLGAP